MPHRGGGERGWGEKSRDPSAMGLQGDLQSLWAGLKTGQAKWKKQPPGGDLSDCVEVACVSL